MNKADEKEELTLQNVPKAVNYLINEVAEMRVLLEHVELQLGLGVDKHRPIGIEDACRILKQTKNGLNKMIRNRSVPLSLIIQQSPLIMRFNSEFYESYKYIIVVTSSSKNLFCRLLRQHSGN